MTNSKIQDYFIFQVALQQQSKLQNDKFQSAGLFYQSSVLYNEGGSTDPWVFVYNLVYV